MMASCTSAIETPAGWTKPVRVLNLSTAGPAREHDLVTVLQPHAKDAPRLDKVSVRQRDQDFFMMPRLVAKAVHNLVAYRFALSE